MPTFHARRGVGRPAAADGRGSSRLSLLAKATLVPANRPHQYHQLRPVHEDENAAAKCGQGMEPSATTACRPRVRGNGLEMGPKPSALPAVTAMAAVATICTSDRSSMSTAPTVPPPRPRRGMMQKASSITCTFPRQLRQHPPLATVVVVVGGCRSRC